MAGDLDEKDRAQAPPPGNTWALSGPTGPSQRPRQPYAACQPYAPTAGRTPRSRHEATASQPAAHTPGRESLCVWPRAHAAAAKTRRGSAPPRGRTPGPGGPAARAVCPQGAGIRSSGQPIRFTHPSRYPGPRVRSGGQRSGRASVLPQARDTASPRPPPQENPQVSHLCTVLNPTGASPRRKSTHRP